MNCRDVGSTVVRQEKSKLYEVRSTLYDRWITGRPQLEEEQGCRNTRVSRLSTLEK